MEDRTGFSSDELLNNIYESEAILVKGPAGSGKSTLAVNITVDWAKSDVSSFDLVLFLSSQHRKVNLPLHDLLWGEFVSQIGADSKEIYRELLERKGKICVIIDGPGNKFFIVNCCVISSIMHRALGIMGIRDR